MFRVVFVLFCLFTSAVYAEPVSSVCQQRHCLGVVDAGSTGSRLHIYAYDLDDKKAPVNISQIWINKTTPGFANIEPNQETMDAYLKNLFANAPEENLPVYFYATAGMRLISKPKQLQRYKALEQWFSTRKQWTLLEAKTISGKQEGVFGWLAVNYQSGALQSADKPLASVMDMGGASVQVVIPVKNTDAADPDDLVQLDTYNRPITLFVHSFLGLGQTEVSHQFLNNAHCFSYDYPLPNESTGQGDAYSCQQDISKMIQSVHDVNHIVGPILANNPGTPWHAVSGLSSLVKNKPFNFVNNQFSSQDMLEQADNELCRQSWNTLQSKYSDNDYTFISCLTAAYYHALIVDGYGLLPTQPINFVADAEEPDWTLGAVLQHLDRQ